MLHIIMSRRSLLFIALVVVILYFSIIVFILKPLHGVNHKFYGNNYLLNNFAFRQVPNLHWCKVLHWRIPPAPHAVALVSFPGSGNTWFRYLLQQTTGLYTGSIYMDYSLRMNGFLAENVTDGSVLVVKTHEDPPIELNKFTSAILLIRDPRDAILADFNRIHKGHVGSAPKSAFLINLSKSRSSSTDWSYSYVSSQLTAWESLHRAWLTRFRGRVLLVRYERLVHNTASELRRAVAFLNRSVTEEELNCTLQHKEGIYRRKQKLHNFDPFTEDMYRVIGVVKARVDRLIQDYYANNYISNSSVPI